MPKRRVTAALVVAGLASMVGAARADEGQPFRTRNLSPLVSIFGIPAWSNAPSEGTRVGVSVELANHYRLSSRGSEALVLSPQGHVEHHLVVAERGGTTWADVAPGS